MRALIVDDSSFLRLHLRDQLTKLGFECEEAGNGREALDVLQKRSAFDLLLMDVNMPGMDGLECVNRVRGEGLAPRTKVMMVTTEMDASYVDRALRFGADEFLMKPFSPQSLKGKLLLLGLMRGA